MIFLFTSRPYSRALGMPVYDHSHCDHQSGTRGGIADDIVWSGLLSLLSTNHLYLLIDRSQIFRIVSLASISAHLRIHPSPGRFPIRRSARLAAMGGRYCLIASWGSGTASDVFKTLSTPHPLSFVPLRQLQPVAGNGGNTVDTAL